MAIKNEDALKPGDVVSYSDMANPERTYVILETPNEAHPFDFKMLCITGGEDTPGYDNPMEPHYAGVRQHGWNLVATAADL